MTMEINIDRLRLKMPQARSSKGGAEGRFLAQSVATGLAKSFPRSRVAPTGATIDRVHVTLPRGKVTADTAVRAIQKAIGTRLDAARRRR
jgi:hypothetical protein